MTTTTTTTTLLQEARGRQGLGLREAARLAEVDPGYLSRVERGVQGLSLRMLATLAPVYGLGPGDLKRVLEEVQQREDDDEGAQGEPEGVPA